MRGAPRGIQCTLGSLPCSAARARWMANASGFSGKTLLLREDAIFMNSAGICVSLHFAPQLARVTHPYMPVKSGCPSDVRGAGAAILGLPSGPLGTPAVGYPKYCADNAVALPAKIIRTPPNWTLKRRVTNLLPPLPLESLMPRRADIKGPSGTRLSAT